MENTTAHHLRSGAPEIRRTDADRLHSPSRERILREVETLGQVTVAEVAARTGLHENTVRGHLARLLADGYVRRQPGTPSGQGRPVDTWQVAPTEQLHPYAALAVSMTEALATESNQPHAAARQAGKLWGAQLARDNPPGDNASAEEVVDQVMREQGFSPERLHDRSVLNRCPLLSAAHRSDLVCAAHEGMAEAVAQSRDPELTAQLEPFAHHGACVLRLLNAS